MPKPNAVRWIVHDLQARQWVCTTRLHDRSRFELQLFSFSSVSWSPRSVVRRRRRSARIRTSTHAHARTFTRMHSGACALRDRSDRRVTNATFRHRFVKIKSPQDGTTHAYVPGHSLLECFPRRHAVFAGGSDDAGPGRYGSLVLEYEIGNFRAELDGSIHLYINSIHAATVRDLVSGCDRDRLRASLCTDGYVMCARLWRNIPLTAVVHEHVHLHVRVYLYACMQTCI